jgi:hypothetical protein
MRLGEYASAGWFNAAEIQSLATPIGRRRSLAWAKANGQGKLMRNYIRDVTRLAFTRNRIVTQRDNRVNAQAEEAALLGTITAERSQLAAALAQAPIR